MKTTGIQPESPRRGRRFQYSLRTLLMVMLLASMGMSWISVRMRRAQRQREAVETMWTLGGTTAYDYELDSSLNPGASGRRPPAWLRNLFGNDLFADVSYLRVRDDDGMKHATNFAKLRRVEAEGYSGFVTGPKTNRSEEYYEFMRSKSGVTDAGLEYVKGLDQLQVLKLACTHVTDAGLKHLRNLSQLQQLDLAGTTVEGTGLEHLAELTQLERLLVDTL